MPTYEYACQACGEQWEAFQSMKDPPLTDCPACGKPKAKRQISAGLGFILKGGGWYSDLYASAKPGTEKSSNGASDTPNGKKNGAESKSSDGASKKDASSASSSSTTPKAASSSKD